MLTEQHIPDGIHILQACFLCMVKLGLQIGSKHVSTALEDKYCPSLYTHTNKLQYHKQDIQNPSPPLPPKKTISKESPNLSKVDSFRFTKIHFTHIRVMLISN